MEFGFNLSRLYRSVFRLATQDFDHWLSVKQFALRLLLAPATETQAFRELALSLYAQQLLCKSKVRRILELTGH